MELLVFGPLRAATGEKTVEVEPDGDTVGAVVDAFVAEYPRTASQLVDEDGDVRPSVRVMVDGEQVALDRSLAETETVQLFPAMRGG